jgi:hypothetical protein
MHLYGIEPNGQRGFLSPWAELSQLQQEAAYEASRGSLGLVEVDTSDTNWSHPMNGVAVRIFIPTCILSTYIGIGCGRTNGLLLASVLIGRSFSSLDAPGTDACFDV